MPGNDAFTKILLHFDGADGGTTITDSNFGGSAHTWTANGNANTDTGIVKFGTAALLCDGTGDYVSTPDHADFTLGSGNWVFDCWFNRAGGDGTRRFLFGQLDSAGAIVSASIYCELNASNQLVARADAGEISTGLTSAGTYTATGWRHLAFLRSGGNLYLFVDGAQVATAAFSNTINNSTNAFSIGRGGEITTLAWNGSIDEARLSVGTDRGWSGGFTPPTVAYDAVVEGVFSAAGASTVSGDGASNVAAVASSVGLSTASSVGASNVAAVAVSAGTATGSFVGTGVFNSVGNAAGLSTGAYVGTGVFNSIAAATGVAIVNGQSIILPIVNTTTIQKPVDYWLAGGPTPERARVNAQIARMIFRL